MFFSIFALFSSICALFAAAPGVPAVTLALILETVVSKEVNRVSKLSTSAAFTAPTPLVNTNAAATTAAFLPLDLANSDVTT